MFEEDAKGYTWQRNHQQRRVENQGQQTLVEGVMSEESFDTVGGRTNCYSLLGNQCLSF